MAQQITTFWASRYPEETTAQNQIRVTSDDSSNTVFVQAAPADLEQIGRLIEMLDTMSSDAKNNLRIVPLKNAVSSELAALLVQAISQGVVPSSGATVPGVVPTLPGAAPGAAPGAFPGAAPGAFPGAAPGGLPGAFPGAAGAGAGLAGAAAQAGIKTKSTSLRFISPSTGAAIESGFLEDIYIQPEIRLNALLVSAPEKTMELILSLIRELDVTPQARAEISIFAAEEGRRDDAGAHAPAALPGRRGR
jgi:type II secretory pathway component GspD/PulD (secretin)